MYNIRYKMTRKSGWSNWLTVFAVLNLFTGFSYAWMNQRPVLEVQDGNLVITSAADRNITMKTIGTSSVNVNGINLVDVAVSAREASKLVEAWKLGALAEMQSTLSRIAQTIEGRSGVLTRLSALEFGTDSNTTTARPGRNRRPTAANDALARTRIQRLTARVRQTEIQISNLLRKIETNECVSNPCQNGGTCEDLIDGYKCICMEGWEGPQCIRDINECDRYAGTDLGCQNGGSCQNLPGSYHCICISDWHGIHCTQKLSSCESQNSYELCGHGTCLDRPKSTPGYTCLCDPGWEADSASPACIKDVDECSSKRLPCSVNPMVPCINVPGTFYCGACPQGYTGNGYYCADIDECATNNGGCSITPSVQCMNTMGSRICGSCPAGYQGDGVTCSYVGPCRINNGGCHPLATCMNNPGMSDMFVVCHCPQGYVGDGMGPNGCYINPSAPDSPCSSNPCSHGTCTSIGNRDYNCRCESGYTGKNCDAQTNPCDPNPCRNQGTCIISASRTATCRCTVNFSGSRCETRKASCGAIIYDTEGSLQFPTVGNNYPHGLSCAWVLVTNNTMVLNVTFTAFNLEQSTDCQFDFVQIHDGPTAGEHLIGRYCGNQLPQGGNIVSSEEALYLWFHSDNSVSSEGFALQWNSIEPQCGGQINADHGTIKSPGSPGKYPKNRDCTWRVNVSPGKRIQFHFASMMLEERPYCDKDYLEIRDGPSSSDRQLGLYCNHTIPPPLVVTGDEAWLRFHSDDSGQDFGFQMTFASMEGAPGCGGVYTATSARITSPNYHEDRYESHMDCEWRIQIPVGERVQITWISFDVEYSRGCRYDFVEIYNGADREAPLLGRYCGDSIPPSISSESNVVLIRMRSDWSVSGKGFQLKYEVWCGGDFSEATGVIKSPYYPNPYPASRTCVYKIIQPVGKAIELTFHDMDIEGLDYPNCWFDYLEIHDGDNENSTILGTYCGSNNSIPTYPILSTHNYLWLKFKTDSSIHKRGFMATYTTTDRRCGGILKERSGIIQPPSEGGQYADSENCLWVIQAPPGFVVQLTWLSFDLESHRSCGYDYVKIFENVTADSQQDMGTYCGTTKPPVMTTQSQVMSIQFHTDEYITRDGFMATYIFVDASKVCGGHFSSVTGVITSPNYPANYQTNKLCEWFITAPNRHQIVLNVENFELEMQSDCSFDYLEIRNGGSDLSPLMGKYCGTTIPMQLKSFGSEMYLKFKSDSSRSHPGFRIVWDSSTVGCGGSLTSASGSISSPGYPQPYSNRAVCNWNVRVSAGSVIQFVVIDLDLEEHSECLYDYVEFSEGLNSRANKIGRYCGTNHPLQITSTSNIVNIRFRSDWSNSGRGFHINYQALCHNTLHGFRGVIESPNFPNSYPNRENCSWTIEAPLGNALNLTFSHFDLEAGYEDACNYDYLKISEGDEIPTREIHTYCNSMGLPPKIVSKERRLFLKFISDSYRVGNGFRVEWVVNGCGGLLTHPEGTITSPGYPNPYPKNVDCEWNIEVDYSHSIEIILVDVQLEKIQSCHFDRLTIHSGPDENAPVLIETCHLNTPANMTSTSNKVFIKFHADFSFQSKGFKLTYRSVDIRCGGMFTAPTGLIHSPNYPQNYPKDQECDWLIQVANHHLVNLTFLDFDIEDTTNCTDDYVRIYDGLTRGSPILGSHCHNRLPPSYVSTSNKLLVVMRSDRYITAKGFKAIYDMACGARIFTNDQGVISMDSTVGVHAEMENCTWTIVAEDPADHVTLTFTHIQITVPNWGYDDQCGGTFLQILEGDGTDGPSLGKWCNTTVPPPITSQGNALTIHTTTQYGGLFNIMFSGTYSVLTSACGGNYSSEHGRISTPGYPNSYPRNIECVWHLRTSPGNSISLSFADFDLIQSENCDLDYVEVREENGAGNLLGTFCGQNSAQISSQKTLWIKFRSSADGVRKGFIADYSLRHGNDLSGPSGEIASPLYPTPCMLEGDYTWRILVDVQYSIQITFKDFHIETFDDDQCYIHLTVYDGYNDEAPVLQTMCGVTLPPILRSTSNVVYIKFSSSSLREGSWFLLSWLQVPRDSSGGQTTVVQTSACDKTIYMNVPDNSSYTFNSPGWPNGYDDDLDCSWTFESVPGTRLNLHFNTIDLEESHNCVMDYVEVFSGNNLRSQREWSSIGTYCYSNSTSLYNIEASNLMKVNLHTDFAVNRTGFIATVRRVCGGQLYGPNGVIEFNSTTTTDRSNEWSAVTCQWNVTVKPGRTIEVEFIDLSIQSTTEDACSDHYVMLKNGGSSSSPLLGTGKYCHDTLPSSLQTTGNQLYVKVSGLKSSTRFKLNYREVGMSCGGEILLTEDVKTWEIHTPNFPNIPPLFSECFWTIIAPAGEEIAIHFLERFDLTSSTGCEREYLEIRDGGTESSSLLGRFCGDKMPSSIFTTGNFMYIHFYTDVSEPKDGFKANVAIGEHCGGIIRAEEGRLRSPNVVSLRSTNVSCHWYIMAPTGHTIKLQFLDIDLPSWGDCEESDRVDITEEVRSNDTMNFLEANSGMETRVIGHYCGQTVPGVIESSGNQVEVTFITTRRFSSSYRGFDLNFTSSRETCGGTLEGTGGEFSSPGYPNVGVASHDRYCEWEISAPEGYRIQIDILDIDLGEVASTDVWNRLSPRIAFYNDFNYLSRILNFNPSETRRQFLSTSNTMLVFYWSGSSAHRGFRARYSRISPALCGNVLTDERGTMLSNESPIFNMTAFQCQWKAHAPWSNSTGQTFALTALGTTGDSKSIMSPQSCFYAPTHVFVGSPTDDKISCISGNLTQETTVRSPSLINMITATKSSWASSSVQYSLRYHWHQCGGMLSGPSARITAPTNLPYPVDCVWHAKFPDNGETIALSFKKLNLPSCSGNYVIIRNGGPTSPQINKWCGSIKPADIISQRNQLWIEYHAEEPNNELELELRTHQGGCGGIIQGLTSGEISSPGYPSQYPNQTECLWEIEVQNGYRIGLAFIDRFNLETSANCANDFIQVFDWRDNTVTGISSWFDMGKSCGRTTPNPFNSTSNRLKILFRTNQAIRGDGFHARWTQNCGGILPVTMDKNYLSSPGWPISYRGNLVCNYTLIAPGKNFIVEFTQFNLESDKGGICKFDNVSIISETEDGTSAWCGTDKPHLQRAESRLEIHFKTDTYLQRKGFQVKYYIDECGGEITEPSKINSPSLEGTNDYYPRINCTWTIRAPPGKAVVLRFEKFHLEYSTHCYFDFVAAYSGLTINSDNRLALLCGTLNSSLPVVKSENGTMTVNFITDQSFNFGGFEAAIIFTTSSAAGCGGEIVLSNPQTFRTQRGATYESLEECHWLIKAPGGNSIKLEMTSIDLKNTVSRPGANITGSCPGDYLEVRDGAGPFSDLIGRYCGNTIPPPISSSSNFMWIRLATDAVFNGNGVIATLTNVPSPCGNSTILVNNQTKILRSPESSGTYPAGLRCRWSLSSSDKSRHWRRFTIHFVQFDLKDSMNCTGDRLSIADRHSTNFISEGLGRDLIFSGTHDRSRHIWMRANLPQETYTYCGNGMPHDYHSAGGDVEIQFTTQNSGGQHKGFQLEYSFSTCNRNYTGVQGRILHEDPTDCWFTIEAPVGYTISVYFTEFMSLNMQESCTDSALEIHDGDFNNRTLVRLCGITVPNPVFSTGNKLSFHSWAHSPITYGTYDMTYTTTDQGSGCGGKLFNFGGQFTSPLYPAAYRKESECTWEVSVPIGFTVLLEFRTFDLGLRSHCDTDFMEISDVQPNGDKLSSTTYCGEDRPATYHSSRGKVLVKYHTSLNAGSGWVIAFAAQRHDA